MSPIGLPNNISHSNVIYHPKYDHILIFDGLYPSYFIYNNCSFISINKTLSTSTVSPGSGYLVQAFFLNTLVTRDSSDNYCMVGKGIDNVLYFAGSYSSNKTYQYNITNNVFTLLAGQLHTKSD